MQLQEHPKQGMESCSFQNLLGHLYVNQSSDINILVTYSASTSFQIQFAWHPWYLLLVSTWLFPNWEYQDGLKGDSKVLPL